MPSMYDSIYANELPAAGADAYAGYVAGSWPDYTAIVAEFPNKPVLPIAPFATVDAGCLDIEAYDATITQAPAWNARQVARGVAEPVNYTSVANVAALLRLVDRSSILLWTAHYTGVPHLCSPACGFTMPTTADATQWTDTANAGTCDESLITTAFLAAISGHPAPDPIGGTVPAPTDVVDSWSVPGTDGAQYCELLASGAFNSYGVTVGAIEYVAVSNLPQGRYHFGPKQTPGIFTYLQLPASAQTPPFPQRYFVRMEVLSYQTQPVGVGPRGPQGPAGPQGPEGPPGPSATVAAIETRLSNAAKALAG